MRSFGLHYLPVALALLIIVAFIISYTLSADLGHSSLLFPYISDTGSLVPESCIFAQLLNMYAFLAALCIYCWYSHQMDRLEDLHDTGCHTVYAKVTLAFGLLSTLGISLVANFQESSLMVVHLIGALMTFGFGTLYCILLSHISRKHLNAPKWLCILRIALTVVATLTFVLTFVFATIAERNQKILPHKWDPSEELYVFHALGVTCEWLLAFAVFGVLLTMCYELRDYTLDPVKVRRRRINVENDVLPILI